MKYVWNESIKQATDMLQSWTTNAEHGVPSTAKDTRTLSLNVLAATGFRKSYTFRRSDQVGTDEARTYRNALQTVLDNGIFLMLIPRHWLEFPWLPSSWTRVRDAANDFQHYMEHMLEEETLQLEQGKSGSGGLMTAFVRALDMHQKREKASTGNKAESAPKGLSVEEIFGNIFVINFAGHDTTANTLAFSMILLAANPEIQEWVAEEIQAVIQNRDSEGRDYTELFPELKRCRAILVSILLHHMN